jgi:hypothetical protein
LTAHNPTPPSNDPSSSNDPPVNQTKFSTTFPISNVPPIPSLPSSTSQSKPIQSQLIIILPSIVVANSDATDPDLLDHVTAHPIEPLLHSVDSNPKTVTWDL